MCDRPISNADVLTRVIKRNVSNTFWFIREVLLLGQDCIVLTPAPVRDGRSLDRRRHRVRDELKVALENYEREEPFEPFS